LPINSRHSSLGLQSQLIINNKYGRAVFLVRLLASCSEFVNGIGLSLRFPEVVQTFLWRAADGLHGLPGRGQDEATAIDLELMGPLGFSVDQLMELAGLSVACSLAQEFTTDTHSRVLVIAGCVLLALCTAKPFLLGQCAQVCAVSVVLLHAAHSKATWCSCIMAV
jgi:hypothetical protein